MSAPQQNLLKHLKFNRLLLLISQSRVGLVMQHQYHLTFVL